MGNVRAKYETKEKAEGPGNVNSSVLCILEFPAAVKEVKPGNELINVNIICTIRKVVGCNPGNKLCGRYSGVPLIFSPWLVSNT